MAEYYVLYILFGAVACFGSFFTAEREKVAKVQNYICFTAVAVLLMFRHQSMGVDLQWIAESSTTGYLPAFDYISKQGFIGLFSNCEANHVHFEEGFVLYTKLISVISKERQFYVGITALLCLIPIGILIGKKSNEPVYSWIIFLSLSPFLFMYSSLRQSMAIGLAAVMYMLAEDKRWFLFLITGLISVTFHESAVLLFVIYPLVNIRVSTAVRFLLIGFLVGMILLKEQVISLILSFYPKYEYVFDIEGNGSYRFFLILLMIYILCCFSTDDSRFQNAYMNLFFASIVFQAMGIFSNIAPRAGFYFMNALCVLMPDVIENIRIKENALIIKIVSVPCFTVWGLYCIYSTDWAKAYPYYWLWERTLWPS